MQNKTHVDDFVMYASVKNTRVIKRQLQLALNRLEGWSNETGFGFSLAKTKSIHICRVRGCNEFSLELKLQNRTLPRVNSHIYLGVRVDHSLSWRTHIKHLKASCGKSLIY